MKSGLNLQQFLILYDHPPSFPLKEPVHNFVSLNYAYCVDRVVNTLGFCANGHRLKYCLESIERSGSEPTFSKIYRFQKRTISFRTLIKIQSINSNTYCQFETDHYSLSISHPKYFSPVSNFAHLFFSVYMNCYYSVV